jgi:phthiocerol/phenolphthiocerol synthesis type-I polyketide synthase C
MNALAVGWGAIDDVGFLARNTKIRDALQKRMGGTAISSSAALNVLEQLIRARSTGLAVLPLDWSAIAKFLPTAKAPRFERIAAIVESSSGEQSQPDIARMLTELPDDALHAAFVRMIQTDVADILHMRPEKIDPQKSVYEMGLDSLMGVELVTALEARFSVRLSAMVISESPTLAKLANRIVIELREDAADTRNENMQIMSIAAQHGENHTGSALANFAHEKAREQIEGNKQSGQPQRMIR